MKKLSFTLFVFTILLNIILSGQDKKPLSHEDYDKWKDLSNSNISPSGDWVSYEVNLQDGGGYLWLYNTGEDSYRSFERGHKARFSATENFMAFRIVPPKDTVRKAKLAGIKKEKLPKDSLGIYLINQDSLVRIKEIKSFKVPEEGSSWLAWLLEEEKPVKDTAAVDTSSTTEAEEPDKEDKKKPKQEGNTLVVFHPATGEQTSFEHVQEYDFSKNGNLLTFITTKKDSIDSVFVHYMTYPGIQSQIIYEGPGYAKTIKPDEQGHQLAYLFSADTAKVKIYELFLWNANSNKLIKAVDTSSSAMTDGWCVSENSKVYFSENGKRLFFGTATIPEEEPKDTLTDDEKVSVDIWNWKDDRLQPMQLKQLKDDQKRAYESVYHIALGRMVQLADEDVMRIRMDKKHNGPYAIGMSYKPYYKEMSWDADSYQDVYLINMDNGQRKLILEKLQSIATLSPLGRYIAYYNELDSSWNSWSVKSGEFNNLTDGLPPSFSYEEFDMPTTPGPYGITGWTKNDENLLVYDRYDIWMLDPEGNDKPVKLTGGRETETRFRYINLDPDEEYIPKKEKLLIRTFNESTKDAGFYNLSISKSPELKPIIMGAFRYSTPKKAKDAEKIIWQRMNFIEYGNLWISNMNFGEEKKLSDANPQQKDYLWGTVEIVQWTSADGVDLDGMLYKPENFNPDSSYPMIVYFYETYSDRLHGHYVPKPSRSTVNFTYYASNGYLVFVPDIVYKTGFPGQGAYNSVVSGTLKLMENHWVDGEHIGIQGQSWGGYQVAYLVTQTNMFAAAMAGAPVSNMTSAYGGIRWGSGMSRMFQYEGSQSRIGGTLWEKPWRYIENSPIFFADKVETPLLMMHNDKDGAVPWYQGIEYFVALRRLNKPVWMLTYNGAPHNLKRRADCKDLSIRMQQFFDHYLKDAPAPVWMEEGIPALRKGKEMGYGLMKH